MVGARNEPARGDSRMVTVNRLGPDVPRKIPVGDLSHVSADGCVRQCVRERSGLWGSGNVFLRRPRVGVRCPN